MYLVRVELTSRTSPTYSKLDWVIRPPMLLSENSESLRLLLLWRTGLDLEDPTSKEDILLRPGFCTAFSIMWRIKGILMFILVST